MPKSRITREISITTRSQYTKVDTTVSIELNGAELPTLAVLGDAFDSAIEHIQNKITESYKAVPERV